MPDYTSDDFAAFLIFAGPLPPTRPLGEASLQQRLDYVGKCDEFCQQYFKGKNKDATTEMHYLEDWVEFYTQFTKWYAVRQEMSLMRDSDLDVMAYKVSREGKSLDLIADFYANIKHAGRNK